MRITVLQQGATLQAEKQSTGILTLCHRLGIMKAEISNIKNNMSQFKKGDKVSVRQSDNDEWYEQIYIGTIEGIPFPHFTVNTFFEGKFAEGKDFITSNWKQIKPLSK